jgi:fumarate reductase flavoprotein subunit
MHAEAQAEGWLGRSGDGPGVYELRDAMATTMMDKVGIFRTGEELQEGVDELRTLLHECDRAVLRSKAPGMNPELTFALRLKNMMRLALVTTEGALARTESRGAHYRTDYPLRNDAEWLNRTLVRWPVDAPEPNYSYEPVGLIDLPPGHRGYGSDERIELTVSVEEYNADVDEKQREHGKLDTVDPIGTRIQWGAWEQAV